MRLLVYTMQFGLSLVCNGSKEESSRKSDSPPGSTSTFSSSREQRAEHSHYFSFSFCPAPFRLPFSLLQT